MNFDILFNDIELIAFDTETTGAYPVDSELCEVAAVKWRNGKIVDEFQSLIKPTKPMTDFIIGIHGITNEMVATAPRAREVVPGFLDFIKTGVLVAHHAPFDLGFIALEIEENNMTFPNNPALCSSLLSRVIFPEAPNHKLQTLVDFLHLKKGTAHRALDDAKACLDLTLKCAERMGPNVTLEQMFDKIEGPFQWTDFSVESLRKDESYTALIDAIFDKRDVEIIYNSKIDSENKWRRIYPVGIVRNPQGDFIAVKSDGDIHTKRFYLSKIKSSRPVQK